MLLCIAVHGSKIPLCLSMVLPYSPTTSVLLPSLLLVSPAVLMFLFTFVVSKVIEAPRDLTVNEVGCYYCQGNEQRHVQSTLPTGGTNKFVGLQDKKNLQK